MLDTLFTTLDGLKESLRKHKKFALDLETTGLDFMRDRIVIFVVTTVDGTWSLPVYGGDALPFMDVFDVIGDALNKKTKTCYFWNAKFDINFLVKNGFDLRCKIVDGMVAIYVLNTRLARKRSRLSLAYNAKRYLGVELDKSVRCEFVGIREIQRHHLEYAAKDGWTTFKLCELFLVELKKRSGLLKVFRDVSMRLVPILGSMERNGITLDTDLLRDLSSQLENANIVLRAEILAETSPSFNPASPLQVANLFFSGENPLLVPLQGHDKTAANNYSTNAFWLDQYSHPLLSKIQELKQNEKIDSTFVLPLIAKAEHASDGRLRGNYNQCNTTTSRLCVAADTVLRTTMGEFEIAELPEITNVACHIVSHKGIHREIIGKYYKGVETMYDVTSVTGNKITCTAGHRLYTGKEWVSVSDLRSGSLILCNRDTKSFSLRRFYHDSIKSIVNVGVRDVWDIEVAVDHSYVAQGFLNHNSSSDPNLQNLPARSKIGRRVRDAFIAPDGCKLIVADFSQVEMRLMGYVAQGAFGESVIYDNYVIHDIDAHSATRDRLRAQGVVGFGVDNADARSNAKMVNFSLIYGRGIEGYRKQYFLSVDDATAHYNGFHKAYPEIKMMHRKCVKDIIRDGYVTTVLGRRIQFQHAKGCRSKDVWWDGWIAVNALIQGSAQELIKLAMRNMYEKALEFAETDPLWHRVKILMQIHDELVVEAPTEIVEDVFKFVVYHMENAVKVEMPFKVEGKIVDSWGEGH